MLALSPSQFDPFSDMRAESEPHWRTGYLEKLM